MFLRQIELTAKRLQLLKEALPRISRLTMFWDAISPDQWKEAQHTGHGLGVRLEGAEFRRAAYEFGDSVRAAVRGRAEAILVGMSPLFFKQRAQLIALALRSRLPTSAARRSSSTPAP